MSVRTLAALSLALVPLSAPVAHAATAPKPCLAIQDASDDVGPSGLLPDAHLDVLQVTMRATPLTLVLAVRDTGLDSNRRGRWTVEFAVRGTRMYAAADLGVWADLAGTRSGDGTVGFHAGLVDGPSRGVTGKFDFTTSTVTVTVPYAAFGGALARTSVLRNVQAESRETFVVPPPTGGPATAVELSDSAVRSHPLALSTCRG